MNIIISNSCRKLYFLTTTLFEWMPCISWNVQDFESNYYYLHSNCVYQCNKIFSFIFLVISKILIINIIWFAFNVMTNKFLCYFVLNDCVIAQNILFVILILMHSPMIITTIMLQESFRLFYLPTVCSYFHHSLEKEQPGKECVHIMKKVSIEFRLAPILW